MKRIAIMGCSGSGKSTLARALGERLGLPVTHLDAIHWQPGWTEPELAEFSTKVMAVTNAEEWVIDGGYSHADPDEVRFQRAQVLVLFDRSRWLCLMRVFLRWFKYWNRTRPDMGEGCPEKVDWEFVHWIWTYRRNSFEIIKAKAARHATPVVLLTHDPDIDALISEMKRVAR